MKKFLVFYCLFLSVIVVAGQDFRVVGYLPHYRFDVMDKIDFKKITHLNLAFLNPEINGNLSIANIDIDLIILNAITVNPALKVFVSLAGGGLTQEWRDAYKKLLLPKHRPEFIEKLVKYVLLHKLDGIDIDLEWSDVNEYYSPFVIELSDALKIHGKEITAALPGNYRYADISNDALIAFDFINLMAYDKTGPWRPNDPGPHSPESFAKESITYWRNQGIEDEKLILGVPFYGYDFTDQNNVKSFTFAAIVAEDEKFAYKDRDKERYYNGIPTIQTKTYYALNQVAGVMIWELGQDAIGEYSLLSAIDFVVKSNSLPVTAIDNNLITGYGIITPMIYPNPFQNTITVSFPIEKERYSVSLTDLQGKEIKTWRYENSFDNETFNVSEVHKGFYIIQVESLNNSYSKIISKM